MHQVYPEGQLRDRVLDLDARVHLQKVEFTVLVEELDRARVAVADRGGSGNGSCAHPRTQSGIHDGRGSLLDHLLMTPLHRALPLPQVQHLPVSVCEYLDLDVAGALEILLDVDAVVTEGLTRLALCALECALHLRRV